MEILEEKSKLEGHEAVLRLEGEIKKRDLRIAGLERSLAEKERLLNAIESSRAWKAVLKYYRLRDFLLPHGTRRRSAVKVTVRTASDILFSLKDFLVSLKKDEQNFNFLRNWDEIRNHLYAPGRDKIAVSFRGGVGDTLILSWLSNALRRQFPEASLFLITSERNSTNLKDMTRFMTNVHVIHYDEAYWWDLNHLLCRPSLFDLFIDCRYACKLIPMNKTYEPLALSLKAKFDQYNVNFDEFPLGNHLHRMHGKPLLDLMKETSGIDLRDYDLTYPLSPEDFEYVEELADIPYVTISTGIDQFFVRSSRTTKQWLMEFWKELANMIKALGVEVVQVGTLLDETVAGAGSFLGRTTLRQAAALIKYGLCHIACEGGTIWMAKAVQRKSVALFGPTDVNFFGQPENANITAGLSCSPCWWRTHDWMVACPDGHESAKCMDGITPGVVFREVKETLERREREPLSELTLRDLSLFSKDLVDSNESTLRGLFDAAQLTPERVYKNLRNSQTGIYIHGSKYWEYLYGLQHLDDFLSGFKENGIRILDVGSGRGALHRVLIERGFNVTVADINFAHLDPSIEDVFLARAPHGLNIAFNSIFNLALPPESFDVVFCFSVIEHVRQKKFALLEMLRVLKRGGILVLTFDFTSEEAWEKDLDNAFGKEYRVEVFNENSLPGLLAEVEIGGECSAQNLLKEYLRSKEDIQEAGVEGIPPGMTVGGVSIRKDPLPEHEVLQFGDCSFYVRRGGRGRFDKRTIEEVFIENSYGFSISDSYTVIDIGAFIGAFTLYAAKKAKKVYSFEPNPESFSFLKANLRRNRIENVVIEQAALAGVDGERILAIDIDWQNQGGANLFSRYSSLEDPRDGNPELRQLPVRAITLEHVFTKYGLKKCDFLKMDCEGAEYEILLDCSPGILGRIDRIALEYHDFLFSDNRHLEIMDLLAENGFTILRHTGNGNLGMLWAIKRELEGETLHICNLK